MKKNILSTKDLTTFFSCSKNIIHASVKNGLLTPIDGGGIGRQYLFLKKDIVEFLHKNDIEFDEKTKFITPADAAKILGLRADKIHSTSAFKKIRKVKFSSRYFLLKEDIEKIINEKKNQKSSFKISSRGDEEIFFVGLTSCLGKLFGLTKDGKILSRNGTLPDQWLPLPEKKDK